jgi:hypothetical protein
MIDLHQFHIESQLPEAAGKLVAFPLARKGCEAGCLHPADTLPIPQSKLDFASRVARADAERWAGSLPVREGRA